MTQEIKIIYLLLAILCGLFSITTGVAAGFISWFAIVAVHQVLISIPRLMNRPLREFRDEQRG